MLVIRPSLQPCPFANTSCPSLQSLPVMNGFLLALSGFPQIVLYSTEELHKTAKKVQLQRRCSLTSLSASLWVRWKTCTQRGFHVVDNCKN